MPEDKWKTDLFLSSFETAWCSGGSFSLGSKLSCQIVQIQLHQTGPVALDLISTLALVLVHAVIIIALHAMLSCLAHSNRNQDRTAADIKNMKQYGS